MPDEGLAFRRAPLVDSGGLIMRSVSALMALEALQVCAFAVVVALLGRRIMMLTRVARTDELTGLPNRRGLAAVIADVARSRSLLAMVLLDLRRFKGVNDRYGYHAGDELLR